jgi:hypothetical protein
MLHSQEASSHSGLENPIHGTQRKFRVLLVVMLVILSAQSWFGDFVNVFVAPASGVTPPPFSMAGFFQGVYNLNNFFLDWHTFEGITIFLLSIVVLALSFVWSKAISVRICSILGFAAILGAGLGGYLFVLSGFSNGGNSMQMGGSFLASYALYFIALFYAK